MMKKKFRMVAQRLTWLQPQTFFLLVAGVFGLVFSFVTVPFGSPDEPAHFLRIWQLSTGQLVADHYGGQVPVSLCQCWAAFDRVRAAPAGKTSVAAIWREFHRPLEPGHTQFVLFANTAIYSPVPYVPQMIGVWIGRVCGWPPIALMYAGRCCNALVYAAIGWLAIRVLPVLKWPACLVLLAPLPLFLAGSLSADPMTISLGFLACAAVIRLIAQRDPAPGWLLLVLAISWLGTALCKWAYIQVFFMAMAVPLRVWGSMWRRLVPVGIVAGCVLAFAAWSALSKPMHVPERNGDPGPQLRWIESHPLAYLSVLTKTARVETLTVAYTSIGALGWLDIFLSPVFVAVYMAVTLWATLNDPGEIRLGIATRLLASAAFFSSAVIVATCNYLVWDSTGAPIIQGLQGRYFLPLGLLLLLTLRGNRRWRIPAPAAALMVFGSCIYTVVVVLVRYY